MRCQKCNANLDAFGPPSENFSRCPFCGSGFSGPEDASGAGDMQEEESLQQDGLPDMAGDPDALLRDEPGAGSPSPEIGRAAGERGPSSSDMVFAVVLIFTGLLALGGSFVSAAGRFVSPGSWPQVLHGVFPAVAGLLLLLSGVGALHPPGAARISRRVLAYCLTAAAVLTFLRSGSGLFTGAGARFGIPEVLALAAAAVSLKAAVSDGWAARAAGIATFAMILAAVPAVPPLLLHPGSGAAARFGSLLTGGDLGAVLLVAATAACSLGFTLHFVGTGPDSEKKFKGGFFTVLWPLVLVAAIVCAVLDGIYRGDAGALPLFHYTSLLCAIAGSATLVIFALTGVLTAGGAFSDALSSAAADACMWLFGAGVFLPLLWIGSYGAGAGSAAVIIICTALLLIWGLVLRRSSLKGCSGSDRWAGGVFLIAALAMLAFGFRLAALLTPADAAGPLSDVPGLVVWSVLSAALWLTAMGKLRSAYRSETGGDTGPVCRFGMASSLCVFLLTAVYIFGGDGLRGAMSGFMRRGFESFCGVFAEALDAWPLPAFDGAATLPAALSPPPAAVIMVLALILAWIWRSARGKLAAASVIAGLLTLAAVVAAFLLTVLFIPLMASGGRPLFSVMFFGLVPAAAVRFGICVPAFFTPRESMCGGEGPQRSYGRVLDAGMTAAAFMLFLTGILVFDWGESKVLFQAREVFLSFLSFGQPLVEMMLHGRSVYRAAALLSLVIVLILHVECRDRAARGGAGAFVAALWTFATLGLWFCLFRFGRELFFGTAMPGQSGLLLALLFLSVALAAGVAGAWSHVLTPAASMQGDKEAYGAGGGGMNAIGRMGAVSASALLVLYAALWMLDFAAAHDPAGIAGSGLRVFSDGLALTIENMRLRIGAAAGGEVLLKALWAASLLALVYFYIAQYGRRNAGRFSAAVLISMVVAALIVLGFALGATGAGGFSAAGAWILGVFCTALLTAAGVLADWWAGVADAREPAVPQDMGLAGKEEG